MANGKVTYFEEELVVFILTGVDQVAINFGKPNQTALNSMSVTEARDYIEQGQFPKGSMLPKVEAAIKFVESKKERRSFHRLNAQKKPLKEKQGQLFIKTAKVC